MNFGLLDIINVPLGFIIKLIYSLVQNYGVAIILFTIVIKLLLLPLNLKSQKAMRKQQKIQPALQELQKKYANDQQKLSQETMKLYKDNDVSMMGGCLPLLIQMPILFSLYRVIQSPLRYLFGANFTDPSVVEKIGKLKDVMGDTRTVSNLYGSYQIELTSWSQQHTGIAGDWAVNYNFLGLDLANKPSAAFAAMSGAAIDWATVLLLLIPILAGLTTWLSTRQTKKMSGQQNNNQDNPTAGTMNAMTMFMPFMTAFFAISLPSGMGIYWIVSNVVQMVQYRALNSYFDKKEDDFVVKVREPNRKHRKKRK